MVDILSEGAAPRAGHGKARRIASMVVESRRCWRKSCRGLQRGGFRPQVKGRWFSRIGQDLGSVGRERTTVLWQAKTPGEAGATGDGECPPGDYVQERRATEAKRTIHVTEGSADTVDVVGDDG